jgi:ATP-binding cassette, subfamily B, bacterial
VTGRLRTGRLRDGRRTVALVFTDGFRAAPVFMALTTVFTVIAAVALVAYVLGFKVMTEAVAGGRPGELFAGALEVAGLYTLGWAFQIVGATERAGLTDRVTLYQRSKIARLVTELPTVEHFERPEYLKELDLLRDNARLLGSGPGQVLSALQTLLTTAAIVVLLAVIAPVMVVLPLFGIPPVLANRWSVRIRERSDESVAEQRRLANDLFTLAATAATAKEVRLSGLGGELRARHEALSRRVTAATTRAALLGTAISAVGWLLFAIGFGGAIVIVVLGSTRGATSIGDLVVAVSLLRRAQLQVGQSANLTGQLAVIARTARRLMWLEDFARGEASPPALSGEAGGNARARRAASAAGSGAGAPVPDALRTGIALEGVVFRYPGADAEALRSVDLTLPAGATVALVGENGAGKTTIVKLLCGMYAPEAGVIRVDGTDLRDMDLPTWRSRTCATFQDFVRYQLLAGQTVGIGDLPRLDDAAAVDTALERASATEIVAELPDGLATPLGRSFARGQDLSGGQWQRLALSRGMMRDRPLLVVLDEPTASLDAPTEHAIFERSAAQARRAGAAAGAVTLLISHRFSTVRMADLIVVIDDGRIVEQGSHQALMRNGGTYADLFELQARAYR